MLPVIAWHIEQTRSGYKDLNYCNEPKKMPNIQSNFETYLVKACNWNISRRSFSKTPTRLITLVWPIQEVESISDSALLCLGLNSPPKNLALIRLYIRLPKALDSWRFSKITSQKGETAKTTKTPIIHAAINWWIPKDLNDYDNIAFFHWLGIFKACSWIWRSLWFFFPTYTMIRASALLFPSSVRLPVPSWPWMIYHGVLKIFQSKQTYLVRNVPLNHDAFIKKKAFYFNMFTINRFTRTGIISALILRTTSDNGL